MGWFWEKPSEQKASNNDPLRDLDPSLRDFLDKESPVKYKPAPSTSPSTSSTTTPATTAQKAESSSPLVPRESLYQDGRYAHLWKNYRPQSVVEAEAKSDQEKLSDVLDGYKERKAQIGRAAVENCSFEQGAIDECYENGSYMARMAMCRTESRAFERCYVMQSRFLKALGYLSTYERPPAVDEAIQMHADTLYHRMLDQEKLIEAAKAKGEPVPTFPPILDSKDTKSMGFRRATLDAATSPQPPTPPHSQPPQPLTPTEANAAAVAAAKRAKDEKELPPLSPEIEKLLKPNAAMQLRKRLKGMNTLERELEERATIAEIVDATRTEKQLESLREERRQRRREAGEGRGEVGDFIVKWFGWPGQK